MAFSAEHVILVSVDGLRPEAIQQLGKEQLPALYRFREQGAWTDNARSDFDYTRTLPNHASMMTARSVTGDNGHGQRDNDMPEPNTTLHNNTGEEAYVNSVFDVTHDHGLSTSLYVSKSKFILYEQTYNEKSGAKDTTGVDNGTDKIDHYLFLSPDRTAGALITQYIEDMGKEHYNFSFLHITDTDGAGHVDRWRTPRYMDALVRVDGYLQKLFDLINGDVELSDTAIILVADHGGAGRSHGDETDYENYRIPFYVWVSSPDNTVLALGGKELYELNQHKRMDPGVSRPDYSEAIQPIRNGDAANLALELLGLPAIPDASATINAKQDLDIGL
jgi:predicted AlkP superfamily pyrophosphatase or phosphodiesterase